MKIFIMGQTSLHWGRMEFGNIGNYYVLEPFVRGFHKVFPGAEIKTTLQLSSRFCRVEKIESVPLDLYYGWKQDDLDIALMELSVAQLFAKTGKLIKTTPYIKEVMKSDLVIDFSGDIWGDNANLLGNHRFLIGLIKDRVAQLLGKKTVMLAGSPGPFNDPEIIKFAKEVYSNFDLVTNREQISTDLLKEDGFDVSRTKSLACPAFLFEPQKGVSLNSTLISQGIPITERKKVGFILCGWNFLDGPFDKMNRVTSEYIQFAEAIEYLSNELGVDVILMSHSNGFPIPPEKFELIHGRDYPIVKQLQEIVLKRGIANNVYLLGNVYNAWESKAILGQFDMLISGRIHGAVGALSQHIPTVIIDYGHPPKAHKIRGFADVVGASKYVANPSKQHDIIMKIENCWVNLKVYKKELNINMFNVRKLAIRNFELLKELF
jgi:colanic acid/amylovoran biosynthesis protein